MKAVIYARQSSGSDDISESVETQIVNCRALADKEGLTVIGEYSDLNVSGKTYPTGAESVVALDMAFNAWFASQTGDKKYRDGLGKVMQSLKDISYIVVDDLTRLYRPISRSFLESYVNQQLESANVKIWAVKGGIVDVSQFSDGLIATLQNKINDEMIANQRKKSMESTRRLRNKGYRVGTVTKFGYKHTAKHTAEIITKEAEAVKLAFGWCNKGMPYRQIVAKINNMMGKRAVSTGGLAVILASPEYAGYCYDDDGQLIESMTYPAIVSLSEFLEAEKRINNKTNPGKDKNTIYPLSGLVQCGYCGKRMMVGLCKHYSGVGKQHYYSCWKPSTDDCRKARIRIDYDNDTPWESIRQWRPPTAPKMPETLVKNGIQDGVMPLLILHLVERLADIESSADIQKDLALAEVELGKISDYETKIGAMYADGKITDAQFDNLINAKKTEREALAEKIISLKTKITEKEVDYEKYLAVAAHTISQRDMPLGEYRQLARKCFRQIEVFDDYVLVTFASKQVIKIERIRDKSARAMPDWTLHRTNGQYVISYYYKSFYNGDREVNTVLDNDGLRIVTIGTNEKAKKE